MKTSIKLICIAIFATGMFLSCDKDDKFPNGSIHETFDAMFPNAKNIEWEFEHGYYNAEFRENGYEKEAWFNSEGTWFMTKTDYGRNMPEVIKAAFNNTEYKNWRVDDIDFIEQFNKEPFYIMEVEKNDIDKYLFFNTAGELVEENNNYPVFF